MNHLTEEELILHYYREIDPDQQPRIEDHLAACGECQAAGAQLTGVLHLVEATPMPDARPGFERDVWARLEPRLEARSRWRAWTAPPRWVLAGCVGVLLVIAFVAGRFSGEPAAPAPITLSQAAPASERVLRTEVGDHLDRAQMMLVELVNTDGDQLDDLTGEQARAADLVSANRLFRQSAEQSGDAAIADILDDLERVLLEIANASSNQSRGERATVKARIQAADLLFRVRVIASELREPIRVDPDDADTRNARRPRVS
jgi:hypothetical protein